MILQVFIPLISELKAKTASFHFDMTVLLLFCSVAWLNQNGGIIAWVAGCGLGIAVTELRWRCYLLLLCCECTSVQCLERVIKIEFMQGLFWMWYEGFVEIQEIRVSDKG